MKEFAIFYWLCRRHLAARAAAKSFPRQKICPPHDGLRCYDCHFEAIEA